jgi:hypothetical protein
MKVNECHIAHCHLLSAVPCGKINEQVSIFRIDEMEWLSAMEGIGILFS